LIIVRGAGLEQRNPIRCVLWIGCLVGLTIWVFQAGCGKKGPPIPYDAFIPAPIADLEGMVRDGRVFLRWSMPGQRDEAPKAAELRGFRILREEVPLDQRWCEECPEKLETLEVLRIDQVDLSSLESGAVLYEDRRVSFGHRYVYRVISVSAGGYESGRSNRAVVEWEEPPAPPDRVEATAQERRVALRWDPVMGVEGYRIYRRRQGRECGYDALAAVGPHEDSYQDRDVSDGLAYQYTVRSVSKVGRTTLEGRGSSPIGVIAIDLEPPAPPEGLLAIPLEMGIEVSWHRNAEPDLLGYFVYRREAGQGEYERLNVSPLGAPIYVDRTAISGRSYEYVVTAVDRSPQTNESVFSEAVSVAYVP
jgi:hypothetical protein